MLRRFAGAMIPLLMLGSACAATEAASDVADPPAAADDRDGAIHVAGHWTIEIRNPDGTLAERHEFENALTQRGELMLVEILGNSADVLLSQIDLTPTDFCGSGSAECRVDAPIRAVFSGQAPNPVYVLMAGEDSAADDGQITEVATYLEIEEFAANSPGEGILTSKVLDAPIDFVAGQQVDIEVRISFS